MGLADSYPFLSSSLPLSACSRYRTFAGSNTIQATAPPNKLDINLSVAAPGPPVDIVTWLLVHGPS